MLTTTAWPNSNNGRSNFISDTLNKKSLDSCTAAHATQYQKNKQPNQKVGRRPKQTFLQRRHTDGQRTHEKMLIVVHY